VGLKPEISRCKELDDLFGDSDYYVFDYCGYKYAYKVIDDSVMYINISFIERN